MKYFATGFSLTLCGLRFRINVALEDEAETPARATHHAYPSPAREAAPQHSMPTVRF